MADIFTSDTGVLEPLDLSDVRAFLSMSVKDTAEDHLLSNLISQSRAILEPWVPFWLAVRQTKRVLFAFPDSTILLKGPLQSIDKVQDAHGSDITSECVLRGIVLSVPRGTLSPCTVEFTTGAYVPEPIQAALLIMVRNLYVDRTADPMTAEVHSIINDFLEPNI